MLSRVANSLYWMSRYIERADNTARLVETSLQLLLDIRNLDDHHVAQQWLPIVQAAGDEEAFSKLHPKATGAAVTEFLVFQPQNPNAIVQCICQARENARMVRDQITIELWEELNRLYLFVTSREARQVWKQSPSDFFSEIKAASMHLTGIAYATLIHNEGWWFTQAGRFLERADKTSRILDVRHQSLPATGIPGAISQGEALEWAAILRSCSAWDAYKSINGADVHPVAVTEFLVLSEDFPRSIRFCAAQVNTALRKISGVPDGRFVNAAERHAGRLLAELQFGTVEEIFERGLHACLDDLQLKFNRIGDALFEAYFFLSFAALSEADFVQQEEQQQQQGAPGAEASHAWFSVSCPGVGWVDFDPTNNLLPSDEPITVACGRDFSDVSPVSGILVGGGSHAIPVAVEVREGEEGPA
ncbi:MAG: alpha-E domain-containing protein [Verrucomicrobiota bacterium]